MPNPVRGSILVCRLDFPFRRCRWLHKKVHDGPPKKHTSKYTHIYIYIILCKIHTHRHTFWGPPAPRVFATRSHSPSPLRFFWGPGLWWPWMANRCFARTSKEKSSCPSVRSCDPGQVFHRRLKPFAGLESPKTAGSTHFWGILGVDSFSILFNHPSFQKPAVCSGFWVDF